MDYPNIWKYWTCKEKYYVTKCKINEQEVFAHDKWVLQLGFPPSFTNNFSLPIYMYYLVTLHYLKICV